MGVHLYSNGAWTDSGKIYRNSLNLLSPIPYKTNYYINANGEELELANFNIWQFVPNAEIYTLSINIPLSGDNVRVHGYKNDVWVEQIIFSLIQNLPILITIPTNIDTVRISMPNETEYHTMLNIGSTALPYEPYNVVDWYTNHGRGYSSGAWS